MPHSRSRSRSPNAKPAAMKHTLAVLRSRVVKAGDLNVKSGKIAKYDRIWEKAEPLNEAQAKALSYSAERYHLFAEDTGKGLRYLLATVPTVEALVTRDPRLGSANRPGYSLVRADRITGFSQIEPLGIWKSNRGPRGGPKKIKSKSTAGQPRPQRNLTTYYLEKALVDEGVRLAKEHWERVIPIAANRPSFATLRADLEKSIGSDHRYATESDVRYEAERILGLSKNAAGKEVRDIGQWIANEAKKVEEFEKWLVTHKLNFKLVKYPARKIEKDGVVTSTKLHYVIMSHGRFMTLNMAPRLGEKGIPHDKFKHLSGSFYQADDGLVAAERKKIVAEKRQKRQKVKLEKEKIASQPENKVRVAAVKKHKAALARISRQLKKNEEAVLLAKARSAEVSLLQ
jgi:hypothetical protein